MLNFVLYVMTVTNVSHVAKPLLHVDVNIICASLFVYLVIINVEEIICMSFKVLMWWYHDCNGEAIICFLKTMYMYLTIYY